MTQEQDRLTEPDYPPGDVIRGHRNFPARGPGQVTCGPHQGPAQPGMQPGVFGANVIPQRCARGEILSPTGVQKHDRRDGTDQLGSPHPAVWTTLSVWTPVLLVLTHPKWSSRARSWGGVGDAGAS